MRLHPAVVTLLALLLARFSLRAGEGALTELTAGNALGAGLLALAAVVLAAGIAWLLWPLVWLAMRQRRSRAPAA